jgi:RNA polymerase sigma-70 factor (ECF subfamily)
MTNDEYREDPLEKLMDAESDEEFGLPEIRDRFHHHADVDTDGNLKNWTAQDFASIYVRFRPHLERHAKRFLNNPVQAEEVVQDAFLYLMTTLPELDSELGVLKFLKWKIRLLSLDVIRSSANKREQAVPEHMEFASDDAEVSEDLERAEDAAIIKMALSKLNPRHREALLATVYEEKPAEEVAKQLGLSENATRQLLFRARAAFRKALVGEVDTAGLSMGQLLSVAAKKAAYDAKQNAVKVGGFIAVLALAIGVVPSMLAGDEQQIVAEAPVSTPEVEASPAPSVDPVIPTPAPAEESTDSEPAPTEDSTDSETVSEQPQESTEVIDVDSGEVSESNVTVEVGTNQPPQDEVSQTPEPSFSTASFDSILRTDVNQAGYYTNSYSSKFSDVFQGVSIEVFGGTGISAFLDVNTESMTVQNVVYQMWVDGERYYGVARFTEADTEPSGSGYVITHTSSDFYVVDDDGNVFSDSPLADADATVTINIDSNGTPTKAGLKVNR